MTFKEWKETDEYQQLCETFGYFGYVEAIAETAYLAAQKSRATPIVAANVTKQQPLNRY